jgi:hypothetical protein
LLVDLVAMGTSGASIALFAYVARHDNHAGENYLTSLITVTAIAVLVGTIALQWAHHALARRNRSAASKHRVKPQPTHGQLNGHPTRRGRSPTGTPSRSGHVRFSGRS